MFGSGYDDQAGQRANSCIRIDAPTDPVVTLLEMRQHLRLDVIGSPGSHPDDELVQAFTQSATDELDGWEGNLGRCLMPQTWEYRAPYFGGDLLLPLPPLRSIVSVSYLDGAGDQQTLDAAAYRFIAETSRPSRLVAVAGPTSWPSLAIASDAVRVRFTAGYDDAAAIPGPIKTWIKLRTAQFYENREAVVVGTIVTPLPGMDALIERYRIQAVYQ